MSSESYKIPIDSSIDPLLFGGYHGRDGNYRLNIYSIQGREHLTYQQKRNAIARIFELAEIDGLSQYRYFGNVYEMDTI